ncbi:MAG TPA: type II toxin-antitoxin system HicB family antitoxin [Phenylobacterium sp.]|jgi:predicted RNase H-like HicB family nuclease|uniref:type II toxin-antitoxin system HicB family antitoxin n=1 Tax=Phenylobacterium sp. TaxID=1871053 RepID=UPI002BD606DD|nr:type II toxin-antitoxin system HicB family antitoxin [Phenylobacterium sp.]HXA40955.1 type II toxin-antitoxin system HicB family antitoxin [Phenylobacterium sp.]
MSIVLFVALVSGSASSGYRARFPDLPDCEAEGRDLGELLVNARAALTRGLDAMAGAGEAWPTPTPLEEIAAPPGVLAIPIDVSVDDPPIRVNISLGERLVQRLDAAAEARGMTRSGFIAQAVRVSLGERGPAAGEFDAANRRLQEELSALGRKITESIGPESPFSRRMADLDDKVYEGVRRAADSVSAAMSRRREAYRAATAQAEAGGETAPGAAEPHP